MRVPAVAALVPLLSCTPAPPQDRPQPSRPHWRLYEKGPSQALYGPDGRLQRRAFDMDGDRRAEAVVFYGTDGSVARAEIDTDRNGTVDRWEYFDRGGRLLKWARSAHGGTVPDVWEYPDAMGRIGRRERDEDGDGRPDHATAYRDGSPSHEETDEDHDGIWLRAPPVATPR